MSEPKKRNLPIAARKLHNFAPSAVELKRESEHQRSAWMAAFRCEEAIRGAQLIIRHCLREGDTFDQTFTLDDLTGRQSEIDQVNDLRIPLKAVNGVVGLLTGGWIVACCDDEYDNVEDEGAWHLKVTEGFLKRLPEKR